MNSKQILSLGLLGILGCNPGNDSMQAEAVQTGSQYSNKRDLDKNKEVEVISEVMARTDSGIYYGFSVRDKDNNIYTFNGNNSLINIGINSRIDKGDIIKIHGDYMDGGSIYDVRHIEVVKKASQ